MSVSRLIGFVATCCVGILGVGAPAMGVVGGTPAPAADRRFDGVGLFMRVPPGSSCGGLISGSCTLIAPDLVLVARHSLDIGSADPLPTAAQRTYRVRFRRAVGGLSENRLLVGGSPCHGMYQEIDVVQLTDAPNRTCDQVIARLQRAPSGIRPIGMELANPPLTQMPAILAGWGYDGNCFGAGVPWTLRTKRGTIPTNWSGNDYLLFSNCSIGMVEPCLVCTSALAPLIANLHDSGAPVLIEVPSTDPASTTPELRLVGTVSTTTTARRPSAWNNAGGAPRLWTAGPSTHIRKSDFDGNGQITVSDLFAFFGAFFEQRPEADFNGNGTVDAPDIFRYLEDWFG